MDPTLADSLISILPDALAAIAKLIPVLGPWFAAVASIVLVICPVASVLASKLNGQIAEREKTGEATPAPLVKFSIWLNRAALNFDDAQRIAAAYRAKVQAEKDHQTGDPGLS